MARWWTKPPIIIAVLGVLAVIITAFLTQLPITQQRPSAGSPAIGNADRDVTIRQEGAERLRKGQDQSAAAPIGSQVKPPGRPKVEPPPRRPEVPLPIIVALITAIATLGAAIIPPLISRPRTTSPTETKE